MKYLKLSRKLQKSIDSRYILPSEKHNLHVTERGVPYELIMGCKMSCSVNTKALICQGHHNHAIRVNS